MIGKRFIFVGNRRFVLLEMMEANLDLAAVIVVANSHLHRDLQAGQIPALVNYHVVNNKTGLLNILSENNFDVLVSNGCPYILPISQLPVASYVNIHPSCLPDLRGIDPVIGSVLNARDAGATCHIMDNGIDTGQVISQIRIPYTDDLDVTTLYQLSFVAERQAFRQALDRSFLPQYPQNDSADVIYYSRKPEDRVINFQESNEVILRKIKAFNNHSLGCEFIVNGQKYRVYGAMRMYNPFLVGVLSEFDEGVVAFSYENSILFHKDDEALRFLDVVSSDGRQLKSGDQLFKV